MKQEVEMCHIDSTVPYKPIKSFQQYKYKNINSMVQAVKQWLPSYTLTKWPKCL